MALTPETGAGLPNADSPNSVYELDAFHAALGNGAWAAISPVDLKDVYARRASRALEGKYGLKLPGSRASETQALSFPRRGACRMDGRTIGEAEVPREWKDAHALLSLLAATVDLQPALDRGGRLLRMEIGPLVFEYEPGAPAETIYTSVEEALRPLIPANNFLWRG